MRRFFAAFLALAVIMTTLFAVGAAETPAESFDRGLEAWMGSDDDSAVRIWSQLADAGNARGQLATGVFLLYRIEEYLTSGPFSDKEREDYLASQQENIDKAHAYLRACAEHGLQDCQFYYAGELWKRADTEQEYEDALKWAKRAADRNNLGGMFALVEIYSEEGEPGFDPVEALVWLHIACKATGRGCDEIERRREESERLSKEQWAAAENRARLWKPLPF